MPEVFKCPACSAPLDYKGKTVQKCGFCGSNVIVSRDVARNSDFFGGAGRLDFGDLSGLTGTGLKIAEIQRLIQSGRKIEAIKVFRETFGVGLKDAKDAVDKLERGESIDISGMQIQTANVYSSKTNLKAVRNAGIAAGGSFLLTGIFITMVILAGAGLAIYVGFNSLNKTAEKTLQSGQNEPAFPGASKPEKALKATELLKFGGEGNGAGKFNDNRVVAVDGEGRIYSGDYQGGKIQVFDRDGKFLNQWMIEPKMLIIDMIADRKGKVYIAGNDGISAHDGESGKFLHKAGKLLTNGLALTPDGKIAATIGGGFTIFDAELNKIREFKDAKDAADTSFGFDKIAADGDGVLYLLTRTDNYVCKFTADGKFLDRFKIDGSISSIAIDNRGRVFISNVSDIIVYDAEGKQIEKIDDVSQAFGMTFNDAGEMFVAERPFVAKYKLNF